jgi:hypothetical protein
MEFCPFNVPELEMQVMLFELLAAPPCSVSVYSEFGKFFTGRIIKMFGVKYLQ